MTIKILCLEVISIVKNLLDDYLKKNINSILSFHSLKIIMNNNSLVKRVGLPFDGCMKCPYLRCVHLVIRFGHFNLISLE